MPAALTNEYGYSNFDDMTFGNGRFVAVGSIIATSTDGTNWTTVPGTHYLASVTSGRGLFVAAGDGIITVSSNGVDWVSRISQEYRSLYSVGRPVSSAAGALGSPDLGFC